MLAASSRGAQQNALAKTLPRMATTASRLAQDWSFLVSLMHQS
jgi:hypothetical protein